MTKLTAKGIAALHRPGRFGDGGGLYLKIGPTLRKSWIFRYRRHGRSHDLGLGSLDVMSLAEAREAALEQRRMLLRNVDPLAHKASTRSRPAEAITFKKFAEGWIADNEASWKNAKHRQQWKNTLRDYVYPVIGRLPPSGVDVGLVKTILQPLWAEKRETASRVRMRIEKILDAAKVEGLRSGDNPASWKGNLKSILPDLSKRVEHHAALDYREAPAFMKSLTAIDAVSARAFEFLILTAARTSEVIEARWPEIDGSTWIVPAERMKAGKEHRVPLATPALDLLKALPREKGNPFIFVGGRAQGGLSNMALLALLKRMKRSDITPHGMRSSFRDWASETTSYPGEVVEMALAHAILSKTESAYRRGDLFDKRRALMDDWANFVGTKARDL